ncbi:MAG: thioredoxin family protein [Bacteroidales bacterium]|nr:thioredoxin family protein [Bacteroidales bacterium]
MKKIALLLFALSLCFNLSAQKLYDENENAKEKIDTAIKQAQKENKHVLIQMGGNWCKWCLRFDEFVKNNNEISKVLEENYIVLHINHNKKDIETLERLEHPERFGFPVIIILDENGKRLHTQNSYYLEEGESYHAKKVLSCFKDWTPKAIKGIKE